MKKTLVDLTYFSFSESENDMIINTCNSTLGYLSKVNQNTTTYFIARTSAIPKKVNLFNLKIILCKGDQLKKWQIPFKYNNFIKSLKPDYIIVHGFGYCYQIIFLKMIMPNAKMFLQANGYVSVPKGFKKLIYKISDSFIDGYLFTGIENAKSWYDAKIFKREKVFEIMEGSTDFKTNSNIIRGYKTFLWVGRLDENKDPMTILKAFNQFLEIEPFAKLTMIYHEEKIFDQVVQFIKENEKLEKAVLLKGYVEHSLLQEIYNSHEYFVLGSHYEGSGYALVEAMACGCVPIVSSIPSFSYMTNNGSCAFLFTSGNSDELFQQFKLTKNLDYEIEQRKVLKQFKNKLSFEAIAKDLEIILQSL